MSANMGADISFSQDRLWSIIYPVRPPNRERTDRKMQVIALGLSRSDTDSLRQALVMLGYRGVYHGYEISTNSREDVALWVPWLKRKFAKGGYNNTSFLPELTADAFDHVFGEYEAITDTPANHFGEELMLAYPDAKIILNRRAIDPWFRSMQGTAVETFGPFLWWCSCFNGSLCWFWRTFHLSLVDWAKGDFDRYGKEAYFAHYRSIEEACQRNGRGYLEWSVEEGWEPLCKFLDKNVPEEPFPHSNSTAGQQFEKQLGRAVGDCVRNGLIRSITLVIAAIAVGGAVIFRLRGSRAL